MKGYFPFFAPNPADKARYPGLANLWEIGPVQLSYDPMYLFLCSVVRWLWELVSGENEKVGDDQPCLISKANCKAIGREIWAGRRTVPPSQGRALHGMDKQSGSYKTVNWMNFLPCTCEDVLADIIPGSTFKTFLELRHAG